MAGGVQELTAVTGNHQLTMWLCVSIFPAFLSPVAAGSSASSEPPETASKLSEDEADIAHYVGGFVCCKLKQRLHEERQKHVIKTFISQEQPEPKTLLAAKSRGRLTNLTKDGQCLFAELETVFRRLFPSTVITLEIEKYREACFQNDVIQDCFHNATGTLNIDTETESVLNAFINLYFKVRAHHKCKVFVENVRSKKKSSQKEKSLRSKLAK